MCRGDSGVLTHITRSVQAEQAMRDPTLIDVRLMRDFSGQRPVDVARSFGYQRLAAMLDPAQPIELLSYVTRGAHCRCMQAYVCCSILAADETVLTCT